MELLGREKGKTTDSGKEKRKSGEIQMDDSGNGKEDIEKSVSKIKVEKQQGPMVVLPKK